MGWKQQHENCHRCQCDIPIDICESDIRHFWRLPELGFIFCTMQEFCQFAELRKKLPMMALAISSFGKIQGKLSKEDVRRAADKVCFFRFLEVIIKFQFHLCF